MRVKLGFILQNWKKDLSKTQSDIYLFQIFSVVLTHMLLVKEEQRLLMEEWTREDHDAGIDEVPSISSKTRGGDILQPVLNDPNIGSQIIGPKIL